jgi:hypothetical protein
VLEDVMPLDLPLLTNAADKCRFNVLIFTFGCFEIAVDFRRMDHKARPKSC